MLLQASGAVVEGGCWDHHPHSQEARTRSRGTPSDLVHFKVHLDHANWLVSGRHGFSAEFPRKLLPCWGGGGCFWRIPTKSRYDRGRRRRRAEPSASYESKVFNGEKA